MPLSATSVMASSSLMATKTGPGSATPIPVGSSGEAVGLWRGQCRSQGYPGLPASLAPTAGDAPQQRTTFRSERWSRDPSADPKPASTWHHSFRAAPNPQAVTPCGGHHSQPRSGAHSFPQKAALEKGKSTKSYPPPSPVRAVLGGRDMWKEPGELLMIQSAFSTDAFRQRGLQVSTWFGFGSPLPSS